MKGHCTKHWLKSPFFGVKTSVSGIGCSTKVPCNVMSLGTPLWFWKGSKDATFTLRAWPVPTDTVYSVHSSLPGCESQQVKVRGFPFPLSVIVFAADAVKSVKACVGLQHQSSAMLDSVEEREGWIVRLYCVFVCRLSLQIDFCRKQLWREEPGLKCHQCLLCC